MNLAPRYVELITNLQITWADL